MAKQRLDVLLVDLSLAKNRDEAQRMILAGEVLLNEVVQDKPGVKVDPALPVRVKGNRSPYVSRGGLKLAGAIETLGVDVRDCIAADLGASTGGFTDCLLQKGAKKIYAVDVGSGQLAYALQTDPRVVMMDNTNCRYLTAEDVGEPIDLVTADLSFISLKTVFPAIDRVVCLDGAALLLVKPQFEIGKGRVGKKGLVKDPDDHVQVLEECVRFVEGQQWNVKGVCSSPITGKTGNIEFFLWIEKRVPKSQFSNEVIREVVLDAHGRLSSITK